VKDAPISSVASLRIVVTSAGYK